MASNCTVTLTNNTEDATHKDVVGSAAMPVMMSQSWQVSVESLNVSDTAAMLAAIKAFTPFTLMWDETNVADNQTNEGAGFARTGQAYLTDAVFSFNNRENSTKSLQFTGSGPLSDGVTSDMTDTIAIGSYTKGQFVRLFLSSDNTAAASAVVAAATQLSLHVSVTLEPATTKDTTGNWEVQEPTGLSYDITSQALMRSNDTITSAVSGKDLAAIEAIYEAATPVKWEIANVSGANQRTKGTVIVSGSALVQTLTLNGPNRANAEYTTNLQGYGPYVLAA